MLRDDTTEAGVRHVLGRFPVPQESGGRGGVGAAPGLWQPWTCPGSCCPLRSCFLRAVSPLAWAALGQQEPWFCSRPCSSPFLSCCCVWPSSCAAAGRARAARCSRARAARCSSQNEPCGSTRADAEDHLVQGSPTVSQGEVPIVLAFPEDRSNVCLSLPVRDPPAPSSGDLGGLRGCGTHVWHLRTWRVLRGSPLDSPPFGVVFCPAPISRQRFPLPQLPSPSS